MRRRIHTAECSAVRKPREWILRISLAIVAVALGFISVRQTLAFAISRSSPERAYLMSPSDGRIAAELAREIMVSQNNNTSQAKRYVPIARQALRQEPISPPALSALAIDAQLGDHALKARQLLALSNSLSRRDLATRLLLIENAVSEDNVEGALYHYDIALRTSRAAPDTLFPVLNAAISDPAIVRSLSGVLADRPPWGEAFIRYTLSNSANLLATNSLFIALSGRRVPIPNDIKSSHVNALARGNEVAEAWSYYRSMRGNISRTRSRDVDFSAQYSEPTVFDWMPIMNDSGVIASIRATEPRGGVFEFKTASTVGGIVLEQMQRLPTGRYRLTGHASEIDINPNYRPYWVLVCNDARELGRVELPRSDSSDVRFEGSFFVDANCPAQLLRLVARSSPSVSGTSGRLHYVSLEPLGQDSSIN